MRYLIDLILVFISIGNPPNRITKFTSWAPNNPDGGSEENYAVLYTQNNFDWHDRPKTYFYYPICQFL